MLTQEKLKELLHYNPDTGVFTWLKAPRNKSQLLNKRAGTPNDRGYETIRIERKRYRSHRLAFLYMTGLSPTSNVDHIDHDTTNNKWLNLRLVDQSDNTKNASLPSDNKSGVIGVCWDSTRNKWLAQIGGKYIGRFTQFNDAVTARKTAEKDFGYHPNHGKEKGA